MQRLDHQTLALALDRLLEELLNGVHVAQVLAGGQHKLALHLVEALAKQLSPLREILGDQRLAVQVQQVKGKEADANGDLTFVDVLALSSAQHLEGQNLLGGDIKGDRFTVEDKVGHIGADNLVNQLDDVRVLFSVVLLVSAVDVGVLVVVQVNLRPLTVVLVLAGELGAFKSLQDVLNSLGRVRQHWLQRNARRQEAKL